MRREGNRTDIKVGRIIEIDRFGQTCKKVLVNVEKTLTFQEFKIRLSIYRSSLVFMHNLEWVALYRIICSYKAKTKSAINGIFFEKIK